MKKIDESMIDMKIGNIEIKNNVFLAPMAGVTDMPFRIICREMGCGLVYSEMVSAKGMLYQSKNTEKILEVGENENPIAVQLFGSDFQILASMAKKIENYNIDIIDINMGCPVPKIVKNGEGSALMLEPKRIEKIIKAMVDAQDKPVTIKIRKGFDDNNINAVEIAKIAEANGACAVTVHGRTRQQYYSGKADWDIIKKVKKAVNIPVIGNGDIFTPLDAKNLFEYTNCDAVMVARGAQGNPWIFKSINHYIKTGEILPEPSLREKANLILKHAKMLINYKGEYTGIREMRRHISYYSKGIKDGSKLRQNINCVENYEDLETIINLYFK